MKKNIFLSIVIIFMLSACVNENNENIVDTKNNKETEQAYEKAKMIFYSLPSPIEMAMIIETANVEYTNEFLSPTSKVSHYSTSKEMALNLGIYSADLSYTTLFDQKQETINYLATSKKLADQLGILNVISDTTLQKIEDNIEDKNKILNIVSETFMSSSAYLEENDRGETAALIVLGGWIEGLYLSVQLVGDLVENNPDLVTIIFEQQFSLEDLIGLLEIYKTNKDIELLHEELNELKNIYSQIEEPVNQKSFDNLKSKIYEIRDGYAN